MGQSCLPVKLQTKEDKRAKVRHYDPREDKNKESAIK